MTGELVSTTVGAAADPPQFREMPGSASLAMASVLARAQAPARVMGIFPTAVYVDTGDTVVAVVTCDGARLPNAVIVAARSSQLPFRHVGIDTGASVGNGYVTLGPLIVRAARWWDAHVRPAVVDRPALARNLIALGRLLATAEQQPGITAPPGLGEALRARDLAAVVASARTLIGLGPGLTPSGDDVLGAALAAFRVLGCDDAFADTAGAAVTSLARGRTTALSVTLLGLAARGHVSTEVAGVLSAVARGAALEPAVHALLRLGHTSGADAAGGVLIGALAALGTGNALESVSG